jgi:hypothetical protein
MITSTNEEKAFLRSMVRAIDIIKVLSLPVLVVGKVWVPAHQMRRRHLHTGTGYTFYAG